MTDEAAIRELIERWVQAVHAEDLDTVLAEHDSDIVMFDVPPPYDGSTRHRQPTETPGRRSSNGSAKERSSRSSSWT